MRFSSLPMDIQLAMASLEALKADIRKCVHFAYWLVVPALFVGISLQIDATFIMFEELLSWEAAIEVLIGHACVLFTLFVGFPLAIACTVRTEVVGAITGALFAKIRHDQISQLIKDR